MAAKFDNIDDVISKFVGTICYYAGKPVRVDKVTTSQDGTSFTLIIKGTNPPVSVAIDISDPKFSYKNFNLGYANTPGFACWWFRRPLKQYQQGLKRNQVNFLCATPGAMLVDDGFGFTKNYISMLSDEYPSVASCAKLVSIGERISAAFHRDFAVSFDPLHGDFTLEFRGKNVGITSDLKAFKLAPAHEHLRETLQEVLLGDKKKRQANGQ